MFRLNDRVMLNPADADFAKLLGFPFEPDREYRIGNLDTSFQPAHSDDCRNPHTCRCLTKLVKLNTVQFVRLRGSRDANWYGQSWFVPAPRSSALAQAIGRLGSVFRMRRR